MGLGKLKYLTRMKRDFKRCHYEYQGTYGTLWPENQVQLKPNRLEMQYVKARIELEGPDSKKWPGADFLAKEATFGRTRPSEGTTEPSGGYGCGQDATQVDSGYNSEDPTQERDPEASE